MWAELVVLVVVLFSRRTVCLDTYSVGAIIDTCEDVPCNENKEVAFKLGIDLVNSQIQQANEDYRLEPICLSAGDKNPLSSTKVACSMLAKGVVGIFGPSSKDIAHSVQSICDVKDVPLVEAVLDVRRAADVSIPNLYPHWEVLARAYLDLIQAWEWTSFTILYETTEGLYRMRELLKLYNSTGPTVVIRQLDNTNSGNYRTTLKQALQSEETHFVLDASIESLDEVLRQAQQVGLITSKYNFIITNLDMQTIDLTSYQFGDTNITGISLIDPFDEYVVNVADQLQDMRVQSGLEREGMGHFSSKMRIDTALTVDGVTLFGKALREIRQFHNFSAVPLACNSTDTWKFGESIIAYMKADTFDGLSGKVKFDSRGTRTDVQVNVLELREGGLTKIGIWNSTEGFKTQRIENTEEAYNESTVANRTLTVITALTDPYAMLRMSSVSLKGNDQFEGFGIDLIDELAKLLGFKYKFIIRQDKANGARNPVTGRWSGMIGDLQSGKADLAIADLTITDERETAVDFTHPFMSLGISILYQKPTKAPPSFFSFADPFAPEVWLMLMAASFTTAISMFIMGRLCTEEWTNPYPCIEEPKYLVNQWSLHNSFWFVIGSLMQQGSEIAPMATATRCATGVWWFFTLIMVSSYTANLAAFLTTENPDTHFTTIKELVEKADKLKIRYGAKSGGATCKFFEDGAKSGHPDYTAVYDRMQKFPTDNPDDNDVGIGWAENSRYAFFMESTSIEYTVQRHCNLQQVGGKLDEKGYGIAMRKHAPYRHLFSTATLKLQQGGVIDKLKRKWWEEMGGQCLGDDDDGDAPPLNFKNISGIFGVTVGGTISAAICVLLETFFHVVSTAKKAKTSFFQEIKREVLFYCHFKEMVKPVPKRPSMCSLMETTNGNEKEDEEKGASAEKEKSGKNNEEKSQEKVVGNKRSLTNNASKRDVAVGTPSLRSLSKV